MSEAPRDGGRRANEFVWPVRVYYEDTDSGGVVYYANYLRFMERARTEWLRALGYEQDRLAQEEQVIFAVRALQIDFRRPARFNDSLQVTAQLSEVRRASLRFAQHVRRTDAAATPLCSAQVRIACLDCQSLRPKAIPARIHEELSLG